MEIGVSAFGNFSTDTGSTDRNQVNINVFRFRRSHTGLIFFIFVTPQCDCKVVYDTVYFVYIN